jgi:acyl-CoA synthetase (AMP-forming)/AMP-acid ligase II
MGGEVRDAAAGVTLLTGRELERAAANAEPAEPQQPHPSDPAQIYYTSGTTGDPKGVVLTHENVCFHAAMARDALSLAAADTFGHIAPLFHLADAWATFSVTLAGGRHRLVESFRPEPALEALSSGITITNLVPTMLGDLVRHPAVRRAYPSLRLILSGGAPIAPALVKQIQETFGCDYAQTYGLTETSPFLTMSILPPHLRASPADIQHGYRCKTGRPLPGVEVRVVDANGSQVPPDSRTVGEIVARGPSVTPGYWRDPRATEKAFRDGWLLTGDLAVMDEEGFINIVDRKKDVILTGGETVFSTEVEKVMAAHPAVQEVAVFGVPHDRWGEAVVAAVVRQPAVQVSEGELLRHAEDYLGGHQVPKVLVFRQSLPRTGSGKIAKRLLREEYAGWFEQPE